MNDSYLNVNGVEDVKGKKNYHDVNGKQEIEEDCYEDSSLKVI